MNTFSPEQVQCIGRLMEHVHGKLELSESFVDNETKDAVNEASIRPVSCFIILLLTKIC